MPAPNTNGTVFSTIRGKTDYGTNQTVCINWTLSLITFDHTATETFVIPISRSIGSLFHAMPAFISFEILEDRVLSIQL